MPAKRLSMRKITDVLRLCWGQGLSKRKAARSCGVSRPAVDEYLRRAEAAGLCWPLRLYLSSFAYVLVLAGTRWAKAQCSTIRARLLKLAASVRVTARKMWLAFASGYPYQNEFAAVLVNLHHGPARALPG